MLTISVNTRDLPLVHAAEPKWTDSVSWSPWTRFRVVGVPERLAQRRCISRRNGGCVPGRKRVPGETFMQPVLPPPGCSAGDRLLGTLPWQAVPWLDDPVHEDHYRTAVFGSEPVA